MSSSTTSLTPSSKISIPTPSPAYAQGQPFGAELSQKRSNSSSNWNAGRQQNRQQSSQPRNQQTLKKQNKPAKKARLYDDDVTEAATMRAINNRKGHTDITHLMQFSLPPRPQYQPQHNHHRTHQRYNRTWGLGSGYHAVDKAKYVHANYRFIVKSDKEYCTQMVDADVHISWDSVLQILASADTQSTNCPICLSVPVAPRMAKCGHIFCYPCLIRYMHSTDDTSPATDKRARWKKCPICEDSIYVSEVRPVRWFAGQEASMLKEGGDVLLRLLKRHPGTTLALPRDTAESYGLQEDIPWYHIAEMMDYARFMKAGEQYMREQYDLEIAALKTQEQEDELMFGDDTTWTKKAVNSIEEAKNKVQGLPNPPTDANEKSQFQPNQETQIPESWDDHQSTSSQTNATVHSLANGLSRLSFGSHGAPPKPRAPFYFYGALPNFYLSPLDIRILKAAYGDFASFPTTILPRVEHISTGHLVDDDLRKRAKYMAHLPYGAEVSMLECDWTDLISPEVLAQFSEEVGRRRRRNHEKEAREERDRLRAEREEDEKRWAASRRKRPSMTDKSFSEADFAPLQSMAASPPLDSGLGQTPPWANTRTQSSFATLASPGTSPDGPRTVWGTSAVASSSPPLTTARPAPVDDGWLQDWEKDLLDEADAIALVEASTAGDASSKHVPQAGKKNKKKKITLMSTNARRGA